MIEAFVNALAIFSQGFVEMIHFFVDRPVLIPALPIAGIMLGAVIGTIKKKIMPR